MKRVFAIFLTCIFLLGLLPTSALAAEADDGGLCPHHQEHSYELCGYIDAVEGQPCGHVHDGKCGYVEMAEEAPCDMGCADTDEDGQIIHTEGCAYAPAVEGAPCQHEHDELCGYIEAVAGQPCGYVCRICPVQTMIDVLPDAEDITPDNRADAEAQLDAISEAWAELTDEEAGQLDTARCEAAISALLALDGQDGANEPMPLAAGDVSYLYCDTNGQNWQTGTKSSGDYTLVTADDTAWSNSWYVASGDVTIGSRVTVTGNVHLILTDGCNLTINSGIDVADNDTDITNGSTNTLTIYGQQSGTGQLTATGSYNQSGIGSYYSGTVTINGGTVIANGNLCGAGIGGNDTSGIAGSITVNGGIVYANGGGDGGAGIGGARQCSGGLVTINGGTVVATGAGNGAGIGSGSHPRSSCKITISGGTITATSDSGAGIGGSFNGDGGTITISGGTVTANGGENSAGIGGGPRGTGGTIYITGGTITARGGYWGAGIGGGFQRDGGTITISGGIVTAIGGNESAGIGGAQLANGGNITVDGNAVVFATGGTGAGSNIGKGTSSGNYNDGTKTFNSGVVFEGSNGTVYGSCSLPGDMTISSSNILTIPSGSTLTIPNGVTLTNNGTITNNGAIINNGTLTNNGTIDGSGSYSGTGTVNKASQSAPSDSEGYTISYTAETITAKDGYEVSSSNLGVQGITDPIPGSMFYVRKAVSVFYNASGWTSFTVADRPSAPATLLEVTKMANSITITNTNSYPGCEFSKDGTSWSDSGTFTGLTEGTAYTIQVRVKATASSFKSTSMTQVVTTVAGDGSTTVKPGESAETGGATITNDGEKIIITGGDGTTTTITPPTTGGDVNVGAGGGVTVPGGSTVQTGDNGPEITVGPGNGGTVGVDGGVTVEGGGKVTVTGDPDDTTITLPSGGTVKPNPDGTVDVPGGSTVQTGDNGPEITVGDKGGTVDGDGSITVPDGGTIQIGNDPATTITPPNGEAVTPNEDGTVDVPGGSTVQTGGGPEITVGDKGGTVGGNGSITVPDGGTIQIGTDPATTITPPDGEAVTPNEDGTVDVPGGSTVQTGDGPEITVGPGNGGTVGGDGSITVPDGGTIQIGTDPATTITPPNGEAVTPNEDGTVDVPGGSTVQTGDNGPEITVGDKGGTVGGDGGVTVPGGGNITVKGSPDDTTITLPSGGGTVKPNPDGTVTVPGGSTVETGNGDPVTIPDGGGVFNPDTGEIELNVHTVTVNGGTGGGSYAEGTIVTITAIVPSGQRFIGWTVNAGGVTLTNASSATTTFTMPAQAVTVTANFENIPAPTFLVTVNGGTGGGSYTEGAAVTITATVPSGQRFTGWTVNTGGVTLADASSATTTFTMPAQAVTVMANFQSNSGGGNSSGGGGGSYTPPTTTYPPTVERPSEGGGAAAVSPSNPKRGDTVTVTPKPDQGYEVDKITVTDQNGKPVEITVKPDGTYTFTQPTGKVKIEITYKPVQSVEMPWNNPFTDVSEGDWYYEAVRFVQERGLMNGYSDRRFGPNDPLSRAQLAQILFNKEGRPVVNYLMDFSDVTGEAWYAEAIRWATSQGIVGGYGNGCFGPNDPITREQLAVMLWRYSGSPAATNKELHFNDTDEISGFALEALRWAVENGILNGYGDSQLGPKRQATRAQVAQMLKNFIENQEVNT